MNVLSGLELTLAQGESLAMVLAVQALVTVFEATFDEWLGQRLAADYFIEVPAGANANAAAQPVLAIYADYGRAAGEVLINFELLPNEFVPAFESFSISPGVIDIALITDGLQRLWQVDSVRVRDNKRVRELADAVFDQTFLLTRAMTFVTLVLAAVALLIMGWVFFSTRAWYFRLLQVWGLTRRQVLMQLGRLALTLTLSITLLALPLGVWLTWVLVHRINPLAFGWSLPMAIYPGFWLQLGVVSVLIGLSITLLMRSQLGGSGPKPVSAASLQGDER